MSDPAAPWWAEVQHLRPREDRAGETRAAAGSPLPDPATPDRARSGRFDRPSSLQPEEAAVATLEHQLADPWADEPAWGPEQHGWEREGRDEAWAQTLGLDDDAPRERGADADAPRERGARRDTAPAVWDDSLEEAFARTPSWTEDEHDQWLMPKGADRIENGRRTIEIRGQVDRIHGFTAPAETKATARSGRRPARRPSERFERRPDRVAMWAFFLGLLLIVVAAFSPPGDADAAVRDAVPAPPAAQVVVVPTPPAAPLTR